MKIIDYIIRLFSPAQFKKVRTYSSLKADKALFGTSPTRSCSITTHMFWAYGDLSNLEIISINSFVRNGYILNLWTYGSISNAPSGILLRDAREILPESRVFKYKNGSYAGFSNLFRYTVLNKFGGLYSDTDVICLKPVDRLLTLGDCVFFVSERTLDLQKIQLNCNLIYLPIPMHGDLIDIAFAISDRFDIEKLEWGYCGPKLLTMLAKNYPVLAVNIMEPDFANPIDYWDCPTALLKKNNKIISSNALFLHCYNEMWRRAGVDKNAGFPKGSLMEKMANLYLDIS